MKYFTSSISRRQECDGIKEKLLGKESNLRYEDWVLISSSIRLQFGNRRRVPIALHFRAMNPVEEAELDQTYIAQSHEPAWNNQGGETWVYVLGQGKPFIRWYGVFAHVRFLTVHFDQNGRVSSWETGARRVL